MPLHIKNSKTLISPDNFKLKVLITGLSGSGKTTWASGTPNPGYAACETGYGNGILPVANKGIDFCEPSSYDELVQVCTGQIFKDKQSVVLDSFSEICKTSVKDKALSVPRKFGDSVKRELGVAELDDYQVMGEIGRRLLRQILLLDKHVVVTSLFRPFAPAEFNEKGVQTRGEKIGGPDLPGSLALGVAAMFDHVLHLNIRSAVRKGKDGKDERYPQRILTTVGSDKLLAKSRSSIDDAQILPGEIVFDPATGTGTWADIFKRISDFYAKQLPIASV